MNESSPSREIVPILSGGGTRLSCYVGILTALSDMGIDYRHIVGVSGGSIVSALAAARWDTGRMKRLALDTDFNQFKSFSPMSLIRDGGLSNGDHFEEWMDEQLEGRTFADMPLDLHVLATDINGGGPVVFNRALTPDMKVSQAVRFSMSIPLLFSFKTFGDHIMADGVILSEDALHQDWSGEGTPAVCFRLRSEARHKDVRTNRLLPLATYMQLLVQTFMNAVSREFVHAEHWHNTIIVNTGDVSPVDFNLPEATKLQLFDWGYETTREYLPKKLLAYTMPPAAGQAAPQPDQSRRTP